MNGTTQNSVRTALRWGLIATAIACTGYGQTLVNLGTQGRNIDFSNAPSTRPLKTGTVLPSTCSQGELFFNTSAAAGQNVFGCSAANTWTLQGTGNAIADPGSNGLVMRTALGSAVTVAAPAGAVVGTTDAQMLTNKSIDASEINTGTISSGRMPALAGDVTTATGSTNATLATVNPNPGVYGDSSHTLQLTVDGKGRVTQVTALATANANTTSSTLASGNFASMPSTCTAGSLYFATDQPANQQIYSCSAPNTWIQMMSVGGSGALAITNGTLDIVTAVVPRLAAANIFTGLNTFTAFQLTGSSTNPGCASSWDIGKIWINTTSASNTAYQVCLAVAGTPQWVTK